MKYVNADVIFPEDLLKEVQKYAHGKFVYIPNPVPEFLTDILVSLIQLFSAS